MYFDFASIVGGSLVNSLSRATAVGTGGGGVLFLPQSTGLAATSGFAYYTVQSGDLDVNGKLNVRMIWRNNGAAGASQTVFASTTAAPLHYAIQNLGQ